MSDISRPESRTASLTAVSAWEASGISADRVTLEKPTPLTATLHRFSHMEFAPSHQFGPGSPGPTITPTQTLPHQGGGLDQRHLPPPRWRRAGGGVMRAAASPSSLTRRQRFIRPVAGPSETAAG